MNGPGIGARPDPDADVGDGIAELARLERAMWEVATRSDPDWMEQHLAADFHELGWSGRRWSRAEVVAQRPAEIDVRIDELDVRLVSSEVALVTYRSIEARGDAHRTSVWRCEGTVWRLVLHQATPTD